MAKVLLRSFHRAHSSLFKTSPCKPLFLRPVFPTQESIFYTAKQFFLPSLSNPSWVFRNLSHGSVNLVISQGKLKFETHEVEPPKKEKWQTKKRLKLRRKKEKQIRKSANKRDPRRLGVKGKKKKQKFANAEERIKYKLEKAKIKEAMLIERLKRYEVPKVQGPIVEPVNLTGEERFFMKKMAQKKSNYVPIGRRGIFGGVILNMHMHWKKHETVKVICNSSKPGQVHDYAQEIARLSGGIPIQIIGNDTIIFYRGKDYVQPEVMSPIDTLSKKRALEKSKYEQSLESVRRFIAVAEKELELYYRHIALYGDPNDRNPISVLDGPRKGTQELGKPKEFEKEKRVACGNDCFSTGLIEMEADSTEYEHSEIDDSDGFDNEGLSTRESDSELTDNEFDSDSDLDDQENSSRTQEKSTRIVHSSTSVKMNETLTINDFDRR
ncbi:RNA-binding, CRM domain containing protein [Trema orientale]|uniref:RNA-binding, CRM domain containing protein n=1 Tax=Trema orientale TaxID=63057 RepID=A0A2P5ESX2_TREOI|nr:RNA-binding, CRM domain containing protein [Trema orientale]